MKVIFSRKGFDSEFGGGPSPILPDGRIISLPIPGQHERHTYQDLHFGQGQSYADLLQNLGYHQYIHSPCHLDPDLYQSVIQREKGWKPAFGQVSAAEGHLRNQNVGEGDIFLFFGWFRRTVYDAMGKLIFDPADRVDKHVLFGFLQVGEKLMIDSTMQYPDWLKTHPHTLAVRTERHNNAIYIARDISTWNSLLPGAGVFRYSDQVKLTKAGRSKSYWDLPDFFRRLTISYHNESSWQEDCLKTASKGQEFVVCGDDNGALEEWVIHLIEKHVCI